MSNGLKAFFSSLILFSIFGLGYSFSFKSEQFYEKKKESYELRLPKSLCIDSAYEFTCIIPINSYTKEKAKSFCEALKYKE